jgi:hypothetical protein
LLFPTLQLYPPQQPGFISDQGEKATAVILLLNGGNLEGIMKLHMQSLAG